MFMYKPLLVLILFLIFFLHNIGGREERGWKQKKYQHQEEKFWREKGEKEGE